MGLVFRGRAIHGPTSAYGVLGSSASILVDTGHPAHWDTVAPQVRQVFGKAGPSYIFVTHPEMPHVGNIRRLCAAYPQARVCGDAASVHLYYPDLTDRFLNVRPGDSVDLGDSTFVFLEGVMHDLRTLWGYDTARRAVFVADALGYLHYHDLNQCGLTAEELPAPPSEDEVAYLNDAAFYWARFTDLASKFADLYAVLRSYPSEIILPAHGGVITDPKRMLPIIEAGMIRGSQSNTSAQMRPLPT
jgi:flavorubredoxin